MTSRCHALANFSPSPPPPTGAIMPHLRLPPPLLSLLGMTLGLCFLPALSWADLYKYEMKNGDVLISSTPRSDLKLIEVMSTGGGTKSKTSTGKLSAGRAAKLERRARSLVRAKQAKTEHLAEHGERHSVDGLSREMRHDLFDDIIQEAAEAYGVPFAFVKAVIRVESHFNPHAISPVGAQGLMQLMPFVADSLNVEDAFDPRQNIFGGAKLLRSLIDRYDGDINLILAAYNAGDGAVRRYDGIPYPQTRRYVASVYHWYTVYSAAKGLAP